jgi:signal peptidase I
LSLPTRSALGVAAVAAAICAWFFLAPPLLGGSTTYVVTRGISMQPKFHTGDLVLLRGRPSYSVGQIVAYHSDDLDRTVMHRIISFDGTHYRFKGDNNDFVDTSEPTRSELIGGYWLRLPKIGLAIAWLAEPAHVPVVLALALLLFLGGGAGEAVRRRRAPQKPGLMVPAQWVRTPEAEAPPVREREQPVSARPREERVARLRAERPRHLPETVAFPAAVVAAVFAAIALSAGIIALAAAGRAETVKVTVPSAYSLTGTFTYGARTARSTVYPTGRVRPGDPIFVRLVPRVRFAFAYDFSSQFPHGIRTTGAFDAVVSSPEGWQRTFRLVSARTLSGDHGTLTATLDLQRIRSVTEAFQRLTGVSQSSYTITLQPRLALQGGVAGSVLKTTFAPTAALTLDEFQLTVAQPLTLGDGPKPNPLTSSLSGTVDRTLPATVGLGVGHVSVRAARKGGALTALVALLAAVAAGGVAFAARKAVKEDEDAQIEREFADWIVPIASGIAPGSSVIEVEDMDSLAQIAEHYERMILRERLGDGFAYLVEEGGTVYRYRSGDPAQERFTPSGERGVPANAEKPDETSTGLAPRR